MRTFDDIIPPSRRSATPTAPGEPPRRPSAPSRGSRIPYIIIISAIVVIIGAIIVVYQYSRATIEVTPKVTSISVDTTLAAGPAGDVPFTVLTAKKTASNAIPSTGTKEASTKASGTITIYNTQSKAQPLVASTRFATAAGLIYRIQKSVRVPAGSTEAPGRVTARVYADKAGDTYNIGPSSFTVPGLAGTAEAAAVYAKSESPMTGGASGTVPVVDATAEAETVASLEAALETQLPRMLDVPKGYVLLPGAATTTYHEVSPTVAQNEPGKANIIVEATVTGIAFPEAALAVALASTTQGGATLGEGTDLSVTPTSPFPSTNGEAFTFRVSGTASLVAVIDQGAIAASVAGKSKAEARTALDNYPEIGRAVLNLHPFWRTSFPEDPASIVVSTAPVAQ